MFKTSRLVISALFVLPSCYSEATARQYDYIVPPMVNVPSGQFIMATPAIAADGTFSRPVETISQFQLSKYHITVAEFRYFAEESGFEREFTCNDYIDNEGLRGPTHTGSGRWDKHRFTYSDYQPVACITWQDANAYANWLSEKTGQQYRLANEIEWEYAAKGGTDSTYFWGDDPWRTQACEYGNFADQTGEHTNNMLYGYSNVGFIEYQNCDDGEAYSSIVGLYRPNPFGLYDMLGNVVSYTSSCYNEQGYYQAKPSSADACKMITTRGGGTWHYPSQALSSRGRVALEGWNVSPSVGFRLAKNGHAQTQHPSTIKFEQMLKDAQSHRKANRPELLPSVTKIQLIKAADAAYKLRWQPVKDTKLSKYIIYGSTKSKAHLLGGYYRKHYAPVAEIDASLNEYSLENIEPGQSFRIVSVANSQQSLPSKPVVIPEIDSALPIPGRLDVQHVSELTNATLFYIPKNDQRPARYLIFKTNKNTDKTKVSITFSVNVTKAGWYAVNYRGNSFQTGRFFSLWQDNKHLGDINYDSEIDDQNSNRHTVYLEQGKQMLELSVLRESFDRWGLAWVEFKPVSQKP
ncbi:SUMF1/EgtB/PvdO family nonheme iron enzyme [Pseudoalteromonas sp. T1lg65]|uniref:SUMF1/EgtB/PvdO family nonheme iron enzyme n=1 Tax=Pseudoalteromonas sp. T1lg65 TaxID=2077101 RepID=UPI003F7A47D1